MVEHHEAKAGQSFGSATLFELGSEYSDWLASLHEPPSPRQVEEWTNEHASRVWKWSIPAEAREVVAGLAMEMWWACVLIAKAITEQISPEKAMWVWSGDQDTGLRDQPDELHKRIRKAKVSLEGKFDLRP